MKQLKLILMLVLLQNVNAIAQTPGTLDLTFGTNGVIANQIPIKNVDGAYITQQLRQQDGKYIANVNEYHYDDITGIYIEKYYLMRFHTDGQIDHSFGTNGVFSIDFSVSSMFLLAGNKILLCGTEEEEIITARVLDNGTFDITYGYKGKNYTGLFIPFYAAEQMKDGGLIISSNQPSDGRNLLIKFDAGGNRDFNFGENGIRYYSYDLNLGYRYISRIKQMSNGQFILGGVSYLNNNTNTFFIRLNEQLNYDSTFSNDGNFQLPYTGFRLSNFEIMNDGKILAGGFYYFNSFNNMGIIFSRMKSDGTLDSTFGVKGTRTTSFGGARDLLVKFILQPDSKIIAIGNSNSRFALLRLTANGTLDPVFNGTGKTVTPFNGCIDANATYVNMEPDGKLLVTGHANYQDSVAKFTMARYHSGYNTSISTVRLTMPVAIAPNPTTNQCKISYTVSNEQTVSISLYNIHGQVVFEQKIEPQSPGNQELILSLDDFSPGVYFLNIQNGEAQGVIKIIKSE
ncbi:MAG: T9SS type A sorting domain-containing protein [Bacteroidota bacterium]